MPKQQKKQSVTVQAFPEKVGKSKRGNPLYATNPFLSQFTVNLSERKMTVARGCNVVDKEGEIVAPATYAQIHQVDNEEFIKLYTKNMKAFFDLSKAAVKVLGSLFHALQKTAINKDEVLLNHYTADNIYQELTGGDNLSKDVYKRGINELIKKEFIAESPTGIGFYYINPNLVFNGDRVRFVTEYRNTSAYKEAEEKMQYLLQHDKATEQDEFENIGE
jgi:hypothetical protein